MMGETAASIGTLGVTTSVDQVSTGLTTPDIVTFLSNMSGLRREGITHAAFEASSHGLAQYRTEGLPVQARSEEHTSELQSLMRISYAVFCLKKKTKHNT